MKKYVVIYHAPAAAMQEMANATDEQKAEGMKPWLDWRDRAGSALLDFGAPLMGGAEIKSQQALMPSTREVCGYSIVQGNDQDSVHALFDGHPHLQWHPEASIELHEIAEM